MPGNKAARQPRRGVANKGTAVFNALVCIQNVYLTTLVWNTMAMNLGAFAAMNAELIPTRTCVRICVGSTSLCVLFITLRILACLCAKPKAKLKVDEKQPSLRSMEKGKQRRQSALPDQPPTHVVRPSVVKKPRSPAPARGASKQVVPTPAPKLLKVKPIAKACSQQRGNLIRLNAKSFDFERKSQPAELAQYTKISLRPSQANTRHFFWINSLDSCHRRCSAVDSVRQRYCIGRSLRLESVWSTGYVFKVFKKFGFIRAPFVKPNELFFHLSEVSEAKGISYGHRVFFRVQQDKFKDRAKAIDVRVLRTGDKVDVEGGVEYFDGRKGFGFIRPTGPDAEQYDQPFFFMVSDVVRNIGNSHRLENPGEELFTGRRVRFQAARHGRLGEERPRAGHVETLPGVVATVAAQGRPPSGARHGQSAGPSPGSGHRQSPGASRMAQGPGGPNFGRRASKSPRPPPGGV